MKRILLAATAVFLCAALSGCIVVPARGYYEPAPHYYYH